MRSGFQQSPRCRPIVVELGQDQCDDGGTWGVARLRIQVFRAAARWRTCDVKSASFNDSRLISTLASAPSIAARARAVAVTRSDFMLGFVIGRSSSVIRSTSLARSAALRGTLVACLSAASIMPSAAEDSRDFLYAAITDVYDSASASIEAFSSSRSCERREIASLNWRSYCAYAFFPRDMEATIAASPAAIAPLAAAALPPPGVAVGAASCSMNGSTPARNPPTATLPLITAARRFSRMSDESKLSTCRNHSAACSRAFLGTRPTISLLVGATP